MIQKIKSSIVALASLLMIGVPALAPVTAYAVCTNIGNKVAQGASQAAAGDSTSITCEGDASTSTKGISDLAKKIVDIFSIIVGIVAVIMIIYGGFRYITSGGDSGSVGNAKNTLIYAIVGLIIVALAQVIVRFVLGASSNVTG